VKKRLLNKLLDDNIKCCITCLSFKYYKDEQGNMDTSKGVCSNKRSRSCYTVIEIKKILEQPYLKGSNCKTWKGENYG